MRYIIAIFMVLGLCIPRALADEALDAAVTRDLNTYMWVFKCPRDTHICASYEECHNILSEYNDRYMVTCSQQAIAIRTIRKYTEHFADVALLLMNHIDLYEGGNYISGTYASGNEDQSVIHRNELPGTYALQRLMRSYDFDKMLDTAPDTCHTLLYPLAKRYVELVLEKEGPKLSMISRVFVRVDAKYALKREIRRVMAEKGLQFSEYANKHAPKDKLISANVMETYAKQNYRYFRWTKEMAKGFKRYFKKKRLKSISPGFPRRSQSRVKGKTILTSDNDLRHALKTGGQLFDLEHSPYIRGMYPLYRTEYCYTCGIHAMYNRWPARKNISVADTELKNKAGAFLRTAIRKEFLSKQAFDNIVRLDADFLKRHHCSSPQSLFDTAWGSRWRANGRDMQIISFECSSTLLVSLGEDELKPVFVKARETYKKLQNHGEAKKVLEKEKWTIFKLFKEIIGLYDPMKKQWKDFSLQPQYFNAAFRTTFLLTGTIRGAGGIPAECLNGRRDTLYYKMAYWASDKVAAFRLTNTVLLDCP